MGQTIKQKNRANKRLKSLLLNPIVSFLIVLPFVKPASEITGNYDIVFDIIKLLFFPVVIWGYIKCNKKKKISPIILLIQLVYLLSTLLSAGDIRGATIQALSIIECTFYIETIININYELALKRLMIPLILFAIITSITMFATYPKGMYSVASRTRVETSNYYWGFDNSSVFRFIPAMLCLGLYAINRKNKKTNIISTLLMIFFTISFLYVQSITAFVFCSFVTLYFITIALIGDRKIPHLNYKKSLILICLIFILLAFFSDKLDYLYNFASEHGKYYSLKARFNFWNTIFTEVKNSPLLGYGIEDKAVTIARLGIDHPHNIGMDVIYRTGLIGLMSLALLLTKFGKGAICFLALLLVSQMDFYNEQFLFYPTLLLCYHSAITNNQQDDNHGGAKND